MSAEKSGRQLAVVASDVELNRVASILPPPLSDRLQGRQKRRLGDYFGLVNFGVNLTRLVPGSLSALLHSHDKQDEFIFVLEGYPTLVTTEGSVVLKPGMCAGFRSGSGLAHQLRNDTESEVLYLEVGDRAPNDQASYPDEDLVGYFTQSGWIFTHKDGSPYR